jgi:hypothetical protein
MLIILFAFAILLQLCGDRVHVRWTVRGALGQEQGGRHVRRSGTGCDVERPLLR